jgi:hypothetical protein
MVERWDEFLDSMSDCQQLLVRPQFNSYVLAISSILKLFSQGFGASVKLLKILYIAIQLVLCLDYLRRLRLVLYSHPYTIDMTTSGFGYMLYLYCEITLMQSPPAAESQRKRRYQAVTCIL